MGRTGQRHLPFDEHFFDRERKTPEQLKELWYFLGASCVSYALHLPNRRGRHCNVWASPRRELIETIKRCLKSDHTLSYRDDGRHREWKLQIVSESLAVRLSTEYGLGQNRMEHEIPEDLPTTYLDHFVRGLYDGGGKCAVYARTPGKRSIHEHVSLRIQLSEALRNELYGILLRRANIPPGINVYNDSPRHLNFTGGAIHRIADYMYRDWGCIESHGLYVPDKLDDIVSHAGFPRPGKTATPPITASASRA